MHSESIGELTLSLAVERQWELVGDSNYNTQVDKGVDSGTLMKLHSKITLEKTTNLMDTKSTDHF